MKYVVVHFDYLHVGESGRQASKGLPEDSGFRYILVIMDDLSNFVLMEPVEVCTAEATTASLLTWCKTLGVPRVWVSDTATHYKNAILTRLRKGLRVDHQFAVACSPWSVRADGEGSSPFSSLYLFRAASSSLRLG